MKDNVQLLQDINDLKKKQHELEIGIAEIDRMKKQLYNDAQAQNLGYDQDADDVEKEELLEELSNLQH